MFMPFQVLGIWLRGLLAVALLAAAIALMVLWYNNRETPVVERRGPDGTWVRVDERPAEAPDTEDRRTRWVPWQFGMNRETAYLLGGLALLFWSLGGGWLTYPRLLQRGGERLDSLRGEGLTIKRPDGTELRVEVYGREDGIPLVLTHGWSLNSEEWYYAKKELTQHYRLIVWDLPGLGRSGKPANRDWSLEKMARDLDAVVEAVSFGPVVLLGHSIGGMILLTYCRLFPEKLGRQVRALVLAHTTYTNPVKTTQHAGLMQALQKPVLEPLAHLMVWLSGLMRVLNWLSYINGSAHRSTDRSTFSGRESRGQLDFITRMYVEAEPAVLGRGFLGMFRYDASGVLPTISVPALVVTAEGDKTCLPEASTYMAQTIPAAQLVNLKDGRHGALFEFHQMFHTTLAGFLAGVESKQQERGIEESARAVRRE